MYCGSVPEKGTNSTHCVPFVKTCYSRILTVFFDRKILNRRHLYAFFIHDNGYFEIIGHKRSMHFQTRSS